jgi:hypothetical protein
VAMQLGRLGDRLDHRDSGAVDGHGEPWSDKCIEGRSEGTVHAWLDVQSLLHAPWVPQVAVRTTYAYQAQEQVLSVPACLGSRTGIHRFRT